MHPHQRSEAVRSKMQIKLTKKAQWGGQSHKSGSTHDVDAALAAKLIARGYAKEHTGKDAVEDDDATATE